MGKGLGFTDTAMSSIGPKLVTQIRSLPHRSVCSALLGTSLLIVCAGCQKNVPVPTDLKRAEDYFKSSNYAKAAESFESYLELTPSEKIEDRALFRLAMTYLFADSPLCNPQRTRDLLKRLTTQLPESPYKQYAEIVLGLQDELDQMRKGRDDLGQQLASYRTRTQELSSQSSELTEDLRKLRDEMELLRSHLQLRQDRIEAFIHELTTTDRQKKTLQIQLKKLRDELEKLKQIDLARMPTSP